MKIMVAFSVVVLMHISFFYQPVTRSENLRLPAASTVWSSLKQDEDLCDECICDVCKQPSASLPPKPTPCPAVIETKWDLWRSGTCLRGVNTWQKTVEKDGRVVIAYTYEEKDILPLKGKANYVNISFPGIYSVRPRGDDYALEPEVLKELLLLVERYRAANLFVVVSFRTGPGRNEAVFGGEDEPPVTDVWTLKTARKAWVKMWEKTSAELKDKENVVGYDLMVEPVVGPEMVADRAENRRRYQLWYDLAYDIASAIRAAGDKTPILVGGANASPACALECLPLLKLPNIVYTVHQYAPYTYTHQAIAKEGGEEEQKSQFDCDTRRSTSPDPKKVRRPRDAKQGLKRIYELLNGFRSAHGQAPVAVNEFGVYRWAPDAGKHLRDEMEYLELLGANYALWLWEPQTTCVGYDEFNFRHGTDFSRHKDKPGNSLVETIEDNWRHNTTFPNTVTFRSGLRR